MAPTMSPRNFAGVLEPPVGIAQHDDVPHAHEVRGGPLLFRSLPGQRRRRQRAIGGAGSAVGAQDVGHLAARGRPLGHDAPEPISASSGCAKITIALSGISVTISSLGRSRLWACRDSTGAREPGPPIRGRTLYHTAP